MIKNDSDLLEDFTITRNLKPITKKSYTTSVNLYTKFNNASFISLIKEAEEEENRQIRWKYRKIKQRLLKFRNFLTNNYKKNYVKTTLSRIITIYKHYEIEINALPPLSSKNHNESPPVSFDDLPDKKIIKKALKVSNPLMKSIILFMSSSGSARRETLNLTINDIILATKEYHGETDIYEIIKLLKSRNDIVPTFKLKRQKTNKYYYTFCSPEAIKQILNYLNTRDNLKPDDKVFNMHVETFTKKFIRLNDKLNLGKVGTYSRFRSHNLRKFHASNLKNDGMSMTDINALQGKTKNMVDESYFFENPKTLKETYIKHLPAITIYSKENRKIKPPEQVKLEIENKKLKDEIDKLNEEILKLTPYVSQYTSHL